MAKGSKAAPADATRRIGLSLGADLCWPLCYEGIVRRLDLAIPWKGERVRFDVRRVTIEPFSLRREVPYDLVLDRVTHWFHTSREWIKKAILLDDLYVMNNPWAIQAMEKHSTYAAAMRLGFPVPETWMIPPKDYDWTDDLKATLHRYAELFDLGAVGAKIGYPMFLKPYDGGAWVAVSRIENEAELRAAYEKSGKRVMHLRCIGVGPQTRCIKYDASAPLHARYTTETGFMTDGERSTLEDMTLTLNAFFGWDFNSCEALRKDGVFHPIDFANACPDSQVTSLHRHFPWLVKAKIRWSLFAATTRRRMPKCLDWDPFLEIADDPDAPFRERLRRYAALARERFDADRFEEFCGRHLGNLDAVAHEFFGSPEAKEAVRVKVAALFPAHEVEEFTERFWGEIQEWRRGEGRPA
jgi:hypothetical protein